MLWPRSLDIFLAIVRLARGRAFVCRLAFVDRVVRADSPLRPVPDVLEESPNDILVANHHFLVIPEVARVELRKLFEVAE